jgi:hypothetical protein
MSAKVKKPANQIAGAGSFLSAASRPFSMTTKRTSESAGYAEEDTEPLYRATSGLFAHCSDCDYREPIRDVIRSWTCQKCNTFNIVE